MKSMKYLRRGFYAGCTALVCAWLASSADAGTAGSGTFIGYPWNFYGYGGDFIEAWAVPMNGSTYVLTGTSNFPVAAPHASPYIVKNKNGIGSPVLITSADQLQEQVQSVGPQFWGYQMFEAYAHIDDGPAIQKDSQYVSLKEWAIFETAQSFLVCDSGPISSDLQGGQARFAYLADLLVPYCPDFSLPTGTQAQFTHGIRGGF